VCRESVNERVIDGMSSTFFRNRVVVVIPVFVLFSLIKLVSGKYYCSIKRKL
jgi:hypothetical protein